MKYFLLKLKQKRIWEKIFIERLTEPIHLNITAFFYMLFGSYKKKIKYDLVIRPQHAYSILKTAELAKKNNIKTITLIEFGVASGAGLLNIIEISNKISKDTGVNFKIYGFDTGKGMPKPESYKDHPEYYLEGDFPMNFEILKQNLPSNVELIIGNVNETLKLFEQNIPEDEPIGFISFDLDYYSSTKSAFEILKLKPSFFLPRTLLYFDDITEPNHNEYCGELLAINEFNIENKARKIEHHKFLENERVFRRPKWIKQVFYFHVLDHTLRNNLSTKEVKKSMKNPYINYDANHENFTV